MKKVFIISFLLILLVSCGSQRSAVVIKSVDAEINRLGFASLWVEAYNEGDAIGEVTRWRVDIDSVRGESIADYEEIAQWGDHNGTGWSPLIGSKQVSKFCVHRGSGTSKYKEAVAKVAVWVRDDEGEYMIQGMAEFQSN